MDSNTFAIRNTIRNYAAMPKEIADIIVGYTISTGSVLTLMPSVFPNDSANGLSDDYIYEFQASFGITLSINVNVWHPQDISLELIHGKWPYTVNLIGHDNPMYALLMQDISNLGSSSRQLMDAIAPMYAHIKKLTDACFVYLLK